MHNIELLDIVKDAVGDSPSEFVETIGAIPKEIPNWFVVVMGVGTVFVGLICIIILCKIVALFCKEKKSATVQEVKSAPTAAPIENRQEIIAAVTAVIAEEMGKDVSALRVVSFKKL